MFKKIGLFFKRNIKNIGIGVAAVFVLSLIVLSAYTSLKTGGELTDEIVNEYPNVEQTSSSETVVFVNPVENGTVHKEYADDKLLEDKTTGYWQTHQAIDYVANKDAKIYAVCDGTIESVKNDMMDGTTITLKINDDLKVVYKSMSEDVQVKEGDKVKSGDVIGKIGTNMKEKADGVHLHFEMYEKDKLIDPTGYFAENNK